MKLNKKMVRIVVIIIILITFPFIINLIFSLLDYIPWTMNGDKKTWISFLGGYLGAFITLGGVWWQINEYRKQESEREIKLEENEENEICIKTQTLYAILIYEVGSFEEIFKSIIREIDMVHGSIEHLKGYFSNIFKEDMYNLRKFKIDNFYELLLKADVTEQKNILDIYNKTQTLLIVSNNIFMHLDKNIEITGKKVLEEIFQTTVESLKKSREELEINLKKYQNKSF